ncbi:MAG: zinc ribbon domain-containing protein [Bacteroidales bacterium]|nr:zinc ribbon domain-containing protein [Candidatus Equimonas faecalis]
MKKFITLLLLCLTGMAAWAADIENVAFKNDAGMYLNAAVANDAVSVGSASQSFSIKAVSGETNAYQLYCNDISRWINSGTSGYLSSATTQTNARYFYFYKVTMSNASLVMASPEETPEVGQKYVIVVKNTNTEYAGYYAIYGQLANGKTNRLDVVNKLNDELPSTIMLTSTAQTSNGTADLTKVVWTVEQLAAPEPPVDVTKTYYLYDKGISQYVVIPSATNANITPSTTDKTAVKFAAVSGGFSIQDANTGNYIGIDTSWNTISTTTAQPWAIAKVEGGITIKNTSGSYAGKWFGGQSGKTKFYNNNDNPVVFSLEEVAPATKECPQCSEAVDIDATVCPKCGYVFESAPASAVTNLNATFSNTGTSWTGVNISVAATDADGHAVSGVTATVTGNTAPKTVSQPGTNCIVINKNSKDMSNEPLNFTISGLPAGSKFNRINLPMYAINGSGSFQQNAGQSDVNFKVTVIEGGSTLYENTITNFNVPQIQKGNLNDLLVYECGEDIVTNGGDVQVNFSMSKGSVNNGMCMAFQSLKLYYLSTVEYTVNVTGATGGGVTYGGNTYNNGGKISATGLTVAELTAIPVEAYTCNITIDGTVINVVYTLNDINASINYTPLTTSCWSVMSNPPADLLTDYEATDLYDIEKTYVIEEAGKLQSTFVYTSGSHRIDIVGVDVVDGSGTVVASDYHFGYSGGQKVDNVYTVKIPAGTYTVRYIATAHSADGSNTNTNGHIDNVFTAGEIDWNGLEAAITTANSYPVGHGLGQYSWIEEGADYTDDWDSTISSYEQILEAREGDADYVDFLIDLLNTAISNLQLNMPKAGTFLRVKGAASGNYIAGDNSISNGRAAMTAEKDASSILYYTENNELIGYQSGLGFINTHSRAAVGNTFEHHSFSASNYGNKGAYTILSNYGGSKVLYDGSTDINRNSAANSVNCAWYLEEVTELPVTITTAGYATLYAPVDLTVPTGVEAYSITEAKDEYLTPSELATIPANTGVVLKAAAGTYNFAIAETAGSGTSLLDGTCATIASAEADGNYVFSIVGGNPGFYKFAGTELKGFKAYYKPAVAHINGFSIDFGGQIVGVSTVMSATNLKAGYDIQGRRINKMQKGINILNGQKIIK